MTLNLRALLALRAVITEGTVTAAAQRLHRTQPVVSRMIAQLESSVGFALFRREGRRLLPTTEGLSLYHETERALAALSDIEATARDIAQKRDAPLRIVAQSHMVHGLLHLALATYCAEHPAFRFSIEIRQNEYIRHWIANRLFDVGFTPQPVDDPQIKAEVFARAPLLVMLPRDHRLAARGQVTAAELANDSFITVRQGAPLRVRLDAFFAASGFKVTVRGETASAVSACQLVSRGLGITLVDPFVANLFIDDPAVVVRPLRPRAEMDYLVIRPRGGDPSTAKEFVECVRETAEEVIRAVLGRVPGLRVSAKNRQGVRVTRTSRRSSCP